MSRVRNLFSLARSLFSEAVQQHAAWRVASPRQHLRTPSQAVLLYGLGLMNRLLCVLTGGAESRKVPGADVLELCDARGTVLKACGGGPSMYCAGKATAMSQYPHLRIHTVEDDPFIKSQLASRN